MDKIAIISEENIANLIFKVLLVWKKESQFQLEAKCQEENEILQWIDPRSGNLGKKTDIFNGTSLWGK